MVQHRKKTVSGGGAETVGEKKEENQESGLTSQPTSSSNIRGQCTYCGKDVLDTQPRLKDPDSGQYQHETCVAVQKDAAAAAAATAAAAAAAAAETAAAAEAEAEVAAIKAAADAARAEVIAEAKRQAQASLAQAQADAVQIAAAAAAAAETAAAQKASSETTSATSETPMQPQSTSNKPLSLSMAPVSKPLIPDGKHVFLSYQWDVQDQVLQIKQMLNERNIKCWMDIDGGMKSDIYDSMAEGLQGAACLLCFMSQAYQDSANCKLELKFAQQSGVPIIPVMMQANFTAKGTCTVATNLK